MRRTYGISSLCFHGASIGADIVSRCCAAVRLLVQLAVFSGYLLLLHDGTSAAHCSHDLHILGKVLEEIMDLRHVGVCKPAGDRQ